MLRVKFPGGIVSSEQLRAVGSLAERYGRGMGDITTRQNIQLHNLAIEDMPIVLDELNAVGLSFTQACGDVWRNVVGCPLAGVDGHELIDTRPMVADLERAFVGHREFSNLPRKFKVSVSACVHHCAQHEINDIGLVAVDKDGVIGYDVWVGGGLGASAKMGRRLDVFARPEQAVEVCRAITELYRDEGKRTKRTRARIKFLVDEWGVERLRDEVERKLGYELARSVEPTAPIDAHRDHLGVHPQAQPGLYYVGGTTLRGRFTADQMIGVAGIAERYGSGGLRCTNRQNIIVVDVPDHHVETVAAELADLGLPTEASAFRRGIISCTGMEFCKLAIVETKHRAAELIEHLERRIGDLDGSIRINLNGCPNACAQYQIADIGLQGGIAKTADGERVQGFIVHIGGRLGEGAAFGRRIASKAIPADDARYAVERIVRAYKGERRSDMSFGEWADRQGDARLAALIGVAVAREQPRGGRLASFKIPRRGADPCSVIARLLRLIAVLLAGLLLGVGAFAALVALGVVRNPLDPVIGGDIALARSGRPGQRVLFVGNSLTYYHDMPGMVGRLAAADPGPEPLIVVSYTRGAARLSDFAGDGGLRRLLHEVRWDDVRAAGAEQDPVAAAGRAGAADGSRGTHPELADQRRRRAHAAVHDRRLRARERQRRQLPGHAAAPLPGLRRGRVGDRRGRRPGRRRLGAGPPAAARSRLVVVGRHAPQHRRLLPGCVRVLRRADRSLAGGQPAHGRPPPGPGRFLQQLAADATA